MIGLSILKRLEQERQNDGSNVVVAIWLQWKNNRLYSTWKRTIQFLILFIVVVAVIVAAVLLTKDSDSSPIPTTSAVSTSEAPGTSSPREAPGASSPSEAPGASNPIEIPAVAGRPCFQSNFELSNRVEDWFDPSFQASVESQYGPIGDWCFDKDVTSICEAFFKYRTDFNGDLSSWDVSSVREHELHVPWVSVQSKSLIMGCLFCQRHAEYIL